MAHNALLLSFYRPMIAARRVDELERDLVNRGEAFFQVSGAGHESAAVIARYLIAADFIHCHYRDKALILARGVPPVQFFHSLLCNAASHSVGRQMSAHLSDPERNVLSLVGPVGNNALQAVGVAAEIKHLLTHPMVVCSMGDGTSQQGEVLEAIAEAVRRELPVLFVIHDNRYSISTRTRGKTFFSYPSGEASEFYGLTVHRLDGRDALACDESFAKIMQQIRQTRRPSLVVLDVERLSDHTNADDERIYRSADEINMGRRTGDPVAILRQKMLDSGIIESQIADLERSVRAEVEAAAVEAQRGSAPVATFTAKAPLPEQLANAPEFRGNDAAPALTMVEAIRETLRFRMAGNDRVTLYGEDIEDPKGDVFGVTRGLTRAFPGRVKNSPVSESTIVGTSIGRALAGGRPVAFIQFADFLPLAFNQIATELGSMYWRANGGWQCPVIIMVACGGYRPGLGPFHAHTFESVAAHVPGLDVMMASSAPDAAGMLNAAFESGRPTIFFYPKACLNDRERTTSADVGAQLVPVGKSRVVRAGRDITLVSWGSTVSLCEKVAIALSSVGCSADVIDLRWLSPWDAEAVCHSARTTGKMIVVHEDNHTVGFGAEVIATVVEKVERRVICCRVARPDTYVPCHFGNQLEVLPSFKSVLIAAAKMLDLELGWESPNIAPGGVVIVQAIGSSPADETVRVVDLKIKTGQMVVAGELLACLECDKATFELSSPATGIVQALYVVEGQEVKVGTPFIGIRTETDVAQNHQPVREDSGTPHLRRRPTLTNTKPFLWEAGPQLVGLSAIYSVEGAISVTNQDLVLRFPHETSEGIFARTGIERRSHVSNGQTALSMAVEVAGNMLRAEGLRLIDIDLIVCSTSTPPMTSPSTACQVLHELCREFGEAEIPALDVMAACTGYLYALGTAWDFLQTAPSARVLVVTTEAMSRIVNPDDFSTAVLFGDAATATVVFGAAHLSQSKAKLSKPLLSAKGEDGTSLRVPLGGNGDFVHMDGKKVFTEAVRRMTTILEKACQQNGIAVKDLDLVIPHQANGRIIEAIQLRLRMPRDRIRNDVHHRGNTSSSTIPLALAKELLTNGAPNRRIGLCAFGAGYTFGAALLETI